MILLLKRSFDLIAAGCLLIFLFPLMTVIAILLLFSVGWPVLFVQERPGLGGRAFRMIKFRTMRNVQGQDGEPLPDSDRLTRLGSILRKCSLDELPELINVVRGDMSLVGPRPLLMEYLPLYSSEQKRRHEVRPGVTGWAQINGRNALSWPKRFELDVWYVDNHSLWLDIKILFITLKKVFVREGINAPGEATMSKFTGNSE